VRAAAADGRMLRLSVSECRQAFAWSTLMRVGIRYRLFREVCEVAVGCVIRLGTQMREG